MPFVHRHIGSSESECHQMLAAMGQPSLDALVSATVPSSIRLTSPLPMALGMDAPEYLASIRYLADRNELYKCYLGQGYSPCHTPAVIQRNVFENPGWYTAYTPYQAEISQGRLEALFHFQTVITELTGLPVANASLLDEATAAAEAMMMLMRLRTPEQVAAGSNRFWVSSGCLPQTIAVLKGRAECIGISLHVAPMDEMNGTYFGALLQYPDQVGAVRDHRAWVADAQARGIKVAVAADLLSLTLLTPPGEWGADVVVGTSQRFGVPIGFGGPHAAFFATRTEFARQVPGRIIGLSKDADGNPAYRMALQTREQHIRKDKATSNICTAQALLAMMAAFYAMYYGQDRLRGLASRLQDQAKTVAKHIAEQGYSVGEWPVFDTVLVQITDLQIQTQIRALAEVRHINFRYIPELGVAISLHELTTDSELKDVIDVFGAIATSRMMSGRVVNDVWNIPETLRRKSPFLQHEDFLRYHTETEMMRYLKSLEDKDLALNRAMIPLGSCTMKLTSATELIPVSWPEFAQIHPFAPKSQTKGYQAVLKELSRDLATITGLPGVSLQPNSGAQGELAGLQVIRAYHRSRADFERTVALIPTSAHGTNPASAVAAGFDVIYVAVNTDGSINVEDLESHIHQAAHRLAVLMVTYPSTYGIFDTDILSIIKRVHTAGGLVYMDGANMNAQVGLTSPGRMGADVCHLNLHKTFAIPHGGGGPGMGPICVSEALQPFLPSVWGELMSDHAIAPVSSAPWGSASVLLVSYGYIKLMGGEGLTLASKMAILNANYIRARLESHYPVRFTGEHGTVAHELIVDLRDFKKSAGIDVDDIAKRLMDYGFHAPTISWPVPGSIMIEPTESESKRELDRFCDAMISIRAEIDRVASAEWDATDNPLKNAPHPLARVAADDWNHMYPRSVAAFPTGKTEGKFWPAVSRLDAAFGDRNLICSCQLPEQEKVSQ